MLSILIPVYNYDVSSLVGELNQQGLGLNIPFEILCYDDGSKMEFKNRNQAVDQFEAVIYKEMEQNLGRSKIRNRLAEGAQFRYLLFMDCDSKVVSPTYLKDYISRLKPDTLLYGGRCYQKDAPENAELMLHWTYGIRREAKRADQRQQQAYHSFMTNNFLIPKSIFEQIKFDESLLQYGHEDTLFGLDLQQRGIPILHFDNPLEHTGIESSNVFIEKTKQALENLIQLSSKNKKIETRLSNYFNQLQRFGLHLLLPSLNQLLQTYIYNNLTSSNPSLYLFDLFKLMQFALIKKELSKSN